MKSLIFVTWAFTMFLIYSEAKNTIHSLPTIFFNFLRSKADYVLEKSNVNSQCAKDLRSLLTDFVLLKRWALEMIDASAKPVGLLGGNIFMSGHFDECLNIRESKNDSLIIGQYCSVVLTPSMKHQNELSMLFNFDEAANYLGIKVSPLALEILRKFRFIYGLCLPQSCSIESLQKISNYFEDNVKFPVHMTFNDFFCRNKEKEVEPYDIDPYVMAIFVTYFVMMLLSTIYDIILRNKGCTGSEANFLITFSLYTNFKKLFSYSSQREVNDHHLQSISGIKVLSMFWIILGHRFLFNVLYGAMNFVYIYEWKTGLMSMFVLASPLAVDTFFCLSGLLLSYGFLKYKSDALSDKQFNFSMLYIYRFLRLGPAMIAAVLFIVSIFKKLGDGPMWPFFVKKISGSCRATWWATLLFVTNHIEFDYQCIEPTWYLAIDSQLFFISPLLLIWLLKKPRKTCLILILACILSGLHGYIITIKNGYSANFLEMNNDFLNYIYLPTFMRMPAWLIGFIFGYLIHKYQQINISEITKYVSWTFIIFVVTILVSIHLVFTRREYDVVFSGFYNGCVRQIWSITVGSMVFLCSSGHGGVINDFLSLPIFQVLVKLVYSFFMVQLPVMYYLAGIKRHSEHFSNEKGKGAGKSCYLLSLANAQVIIAHGSYDLEFILRKLCYEERGIKMNYNETEYLAINTEIRDFMGDLLYIFVFGVIWCLAFESPFIAMGKIWINKGPRTKLSIANSSASQQEKFTQRNEKNEFVNKYVKNKKL